MLYSLISSFMVGVVMMGGVALNAVTPEPQRYTDDGDPIRYADAQYLVKDRNYKIQYQGPEAKTITIVEYVDLQCPFCKRVHPTVKRLRKEYPITYVYKHRPLQFHLNALPAAEAAEAAGEQGKFFEMVDILFEYQEEWADVKDPKPLFKKYAEKIGLNTGDFATSMDLHKNLSKIRADEEDANALNAQGTPTFYINGREVVGALPYEALKDIIEEELKR